MATARHLAAAAEVQGKIYVIGGWDNKKPLDVNESYHPERDRQNEISWQREISLPDDFVVLGSQEIADSVFVLGLIDFEREVMIYLNNQTKEWNYSVDELPVEIGKSSGVLSLGQNMIILGGKISETEYLNTHTQYKAIYTISIPLIIQ